MNPLDLLTTAQQMLQRGQPYALVSVLRVQAPASAKPGDKAVVTGDGIVQGWIGGGCAQPAVLKTVRLALADGQARVIRITPAEDGRLRELDDVLEFGMACHSGGTLELFVDPMLPPPQLVIVGDTPLAAALAGLAPRVGLSVTVLAHGVDAARFPDAVRVIGSDAPGVDVPPGAFVVVATQGRRDLQGLRAALSLRARRVFFVASARKAQVLKASLIEAGDDPLAVNAIVAPAGQAIGAQTPQEIALSVLTAVVAARRSGVAVAPVRAQSTPPAATEPATLPVEVPPIAAGSCCGSSAVAKPAPEAAAPVAPAAGKSSCCGG